MCQVISFGALRVRVFLTLMLLVTPLSNFQASQFCGILMEFLGTHKEMYLCLQSDRKVGIIKTPLFSNCLYSAIKLLPEVRGWDSKDRMI